MKRICKTLGMLAGLVLLAGLMTLPAQAAETEITELSLSFRNEDVIPAVGEPIITYDLSLALEVNDDRTYLPSGTGLWWRNENGEVINYSNDDHGCYFEAGRTYYAEFEIDSVNATDYELSENAAITLTNPGEFTYVTEVLFSPNALACIRLTITMNGARTYPDITKVVFEDMFAPIRDGTQQHAEIYYNNCAVTGSEWSGNVWGESAHGNKLFVADNSYDYVVTLTANDGYKFSNSLSVMLTCGGVIQQPTDYEFSNDHKTLTMTYTFFVKDFTYISSIDLALYRWYETLTPEQGEAVRTLPDDSFEISEECYYELAQVAWYKWFNEDGTDADGTFEAGKTYYFDVPVTIKDEWRRSVRFASENLTTTITGESYTGKGFQKAERVETDTFDDTYVKFRYYFTAQFPEGQGSTASNPVWCSSYAEFKYAMENDDVRHVALGTITETLPAGEEGLVTAVHVNGIKNLHLLGDAVFTAPASAETTYAALLHTVQNTTLNISGTGSLTFRAVANNSYNAVIYNQGGSVNISSGTLIGSYNTAVYGKAIWQDSGELRISGGQLFAKNALAPGSLPGAVTAVYINGGQAWIQGGTFKQDNVIDTIDLPYGLEIGESAAVDLSGGTFHGILLPTDSTPLANYMDEDLYAPLSDESRFSPESEDSQEFTESGKIVRIAWLIDHVDVHINAPVAGVDITENYFNIPTSGCQVTMYYPQWYKNGEAAPYGTFEAGANYKVVVQIDAKADYAAEFANDVTVAINNKLVDVDRKSVHWLEVEYDFGACPDTVGAVALTIDAPAQHATPDQRVTCGHSTYKQALTGDNMFDQDIQWQESATGADDTWEVMESTDTFTVGRYYRVFIDLMPTTGHQFAIDYNIDPDVSATVNGYSAKVSRYPEADPQELICVSYDFGMLNDNIIEQIDIDGVTEPVVGESPDYNCAILGTGYSISTAADNGTYCINGICWRDMTDEKWVYPTDTFEIGHQYKVFVDVKTEDGYEFYTTGNSYVPAGWGYINDNSATLGRQSDARYEQTLGWTFACAPRKINQVAISDLTMPKAGAKPDFTAAVGEPDYYRIDFIEWYDDDAELMTASDAFVEGDYYRIRIRVVPVEVDGQKVCKFVEDKTVATVNGLAVKQGNHGWDEVVSGPNAVTIFYSYDCLSLQTGDVNGNGIIDRRDVTALQRYIVNPVAYPVTANGFAAADLNGDGKVDAKDILLLRRMVEGV